MTRTGKGRWPEATWVGLFCFLILFSLSSSKADAALPKLSTKDRNRLLAWKMVTRVDKSQAHWLPTAMLLMASPAPEVMHVVMDIHNYYKFMPMVIKSRVVRRKGNRFIWAIIVTSLPWPLRNAWVGVKYSWERIPGNGYRLTWVRHQGSMKRYWGRLSLHHFSPYRTLAVCSMQAEPDGFIPRSRLNQGMVWGTEALLNRIRMRLDLLRRTKTLKRWTF